MYEINTPYKPRMGVLGGFKRLAAISAVLVAVGLIIYDWQSMGLVLYVFGL